VDRSYPYGGTQNGTREVHHGVEFYQPFGTPVLAAGPGRVAFAGEDKLTLLGWVTGFYGKVIVLEHQVNGQALYTLYGHLSEIRVETGEVVLSGQEIGAVGASGIAIGSHLHFEVRLGANDYKSTRNPELWLQPLEGAGVLAGRIRDAAGSPVRAAVNIQRTENGTFNPASVGSALTYPRETLNSDENLRETFAVGELPAGEYRVSFVHQGVLYEEVVTIAPGGLAFVEFVTP
jgi:murein DD-endopeptidase MepM/ murein hydrolase activator NlpD